MDPLALIQASINSVTASAVQPLLEHRREWEEVASWFEDQKSRNDYYSELAYQGLRRIIGETQVAFDLTSPCTTKDIEEAYQAEAYAYAQGILPKFDTGTPEDGIRARHVRTMAFIMNQYKAPIERNTHTDAFLQGDVVIDCGAYVGDTAIWAHLWGAKSVYAFEPSPTLFHYLQKNATNYDPDRNWFFPMQLAVGDQEESLPFVESSDARGPNGEGRFGKHGNVMVDCVALDHWCAKNQVEPSFIKMDIEGAEGLALMGAEEIIKTYKPKLAICLYHRLEDMWMLPRLIKGFIPEYHFCCKKALREGEFVLFAEI